MVLVLFLSVASFDRPEKQGRGVVLYTMKRGRRKLIDLVRRTADWGTSLTCGKVNLGDVSAESRATRQSCLVRIVDLPAKYDF
ncbi:hypothetical protein X942_5806 [Burkholderia pseudomallei MSHR5596]|uniref:Uncharacterized protein n=1 Tax=Burkholderia pseudomallei TaxID=28450 RepID=A0AA40JJL9_BURPE|nr:hypothetical protein X942_5806 [Burkholderia pseudomallei MSHR5596]KGX17177.1 hypothetical protein Y036_5936 [Burkholderia pseudomallei]